MIDFGDRPITCFDIDDTIIPWAQCDQAEGSVEVLSECGLKTETHQILTRHVENLKRHKGRGHVIIVWSAGGGEWAQRVVEALKLQDYVDIVMSKPAWYYDDKPCETWMGKSIYLYEQPKEEEY